MKKETTMKEKILDMVSEYCNEHFKEKPFNSKTDRVSVGYPCYSDEELRGAIDTLLDLRLSQGPKVKEFRRAFTKYSLPSVTIHRKMAGITCTITTFISKPIRCYIIMTHSKNTKLMSNCCIRYTVIKPKWSIFVMCL